MSMITSTVMSIHTITAMRAADVAAANHKPGSEQEALLSYMLDHNKHHAAELAEVAKKFRETGKEDVAVQIEKAIENFDKGNLYLSLALSLVQ